MHTMIRAVVALALSGAALTATAQASDSGCPALPASSGLTWQAKATPAMQFCRALRSDGSEAFGLYIARESAFKPNRGDRAEEASIDGRTVHWYRTELAGKPDVQARETLLTLPDGRVAHVWIHARSRQELAGTLGEANALRFADVRVAGN